LPHGESSASVRDRVQGARALQRRRYAALPAVHCNAQLRGPALRELTAATPGAVVLLATLLDRYRLSARAHDRILRVARTIADLAASARVERQHVEVAAQLRCLDRPVEGAPGRTSALHIARHAAATRSPDASSGQHRKEGT
jgi:magnesium chelatase family protein